MPQRPTLADVAAAAGVSSITVSRTIRSPHMVSAKARERVLSAIDRLGYTPDLAASVLASKTSSTIGFLVPSLSNNVFADVLRAVYDGLEGARYVVQIGNFRYSALKEEALIRSFLTQKPAGLILSGLDQSAAALRLLEQASCPVVQIMDHGRPPLDMSVGFSHSDAAEAAVEHLLSCGYRRIGFLGARMDPRTQQRLQGFRTACQRAGVLDEARVVTTPASSEVGIGRQLLEDLLCRAPDTDAVLCNNDDLAVGALMEAQRRNISVPQEFGICGFNDIEMARHIYPSLTTVATPRYEIGAQAIRMILAEIAEAGSVTDRVLDVGFQVVPRQTTRQT